MKAQHAGGAPLLNDTSPQSGSGASVAAPGTTRVDEDEEELEGDEEEAEDDNLGDNLGQDVPSEPNRRLNPLDIRFSQFRARNKFRDGRLLAEALAGIETVPLTPAGSDVVVEAKDAEDATSLLQAPFPPIQIVQWRCKLRDAQGRPRVDPATGGELYDNQSRWFSLDNRRLCCLQQAATAAWPQKVLVDVVELPPGPLTQVRTRQLKKFRTFDRGKTILVGNRNEGDEQVKWSWREKVGMQADADSEPDVKTAHVQMRRRRRENERGGGGGKGGGRGHHPSDSHRRRPGGAVDQPEEPAESGWKTSWGSLFLFFALYLGLRIVAKVVQGVYARLQEQGLSPPS